MVNLVLVLNRQLPQQFFEVYPDESSQFAEMMEMHRKQQLVAKKKKSACGALSFDSSPPVISAK